MPATTTKTKVCTRCEKRRKVDQFYKDVQDMGGRRWDTSSLLARLEK